MNCIRNPRVEKLLAALSGRKKQGQVPGIHVSNALFLDLQDAGLTVPIPENKSIVPSYRLHDGTLILIDDSLSGGLYRLPPFE